MAMGMKIKDRLEACGTLMTTSERKMAAALLSDHPYAGLASVQELAKRAEVSPPSISRFVTKIGLAGYQEFQRELLAELKEGQRSPVDVHRGTRQVEGGYLRDFFSRAASQLVDSPVAITEAQFERICTLLSNQKRDVYILGGRISDTIAQHLSFHLRQTRKGVFHLPSNQEVWPEYLLRMKPGDLLFVVDFRRYQKPLECLAQWSTKSAGARVILMTDRWLSPIARHASEILPVPIESGILWDKYTAGLAVTEAIVTRIAEENWDRTKARIEAWDALRPTEQNET